MHPKCPLSAPPSQCSPSRFLAHRCFSESTVVPPWSQFFFAFHLGWNKMHPHCGQSWILVVCSWIDRHWYVTSVQCIFLPSVRILANLSPGCSCSDRPEQRQGLQGITVADCAHILLSKRWQRVLCRLGKHKQQIVKCSQILEGDKIVSNRCTEVQSHCYILYL